MRSNATWIGAAIAIESDIANVVFDTDADFSTSVDVVGTVTTAHAVLIVAGNTSFIA